MQRPKADEGRLALANIVLSHIPTDKKTFNFQPKIVYMAIMVRRIIQAINDPSFLDDKDYYGNKRLELFAVT